MAQRDVRTAAAAAAEARRVRLDGMFVKLRGLGVKAEKILACLLLVLSCTLHSGGEREETVQDF